MSPLAPQEPDMARAALARAREELAAVDHEIADIARARLDASPRARHALAARRKVIVARKRELEAECHRLKPYSHGSIVGKAPEGAVGVLCMVSRALRDARAWATPAQADRTRKQLLAAVDAFLAAGGSA